MIELCSAPTYSPLNWYLYVGTFPHSSLLSHLCSGLAAGTQELIEYNTNSQLMALNKQITRGPWVCVHWYLFMYIHIYVVKVSFSAWHLPTLSPVRLWLVSIYFQLQRPHERIKYKRVINTCSTRVLHTDAWQVYRRKWTRSWMVWFCRVSKERT